MNEPRTQSVEQQAQLLARAVDEALLPATSYRDDSPLPARGDAPPVPQPGVPPMSQHATDIGRAAMYCGLATVPPGLIAIGIIVASEHADPTVIGMICAAPAALVLALARLVRGAKDVLPTEQHHHYEGPVYQDQRNVHTSTRGVWAKTNNQQP